MYCCCCRRWHRHRYHGYYYSYHRHHYDCHYRLCISADVCQSSTHITRRRANNNNKNYNYNDDDDDSKLWCQVQWRRHTRCVRTSLGENTWYFCTWFLRDLYLKPARSYVIVNQYEVTNNIMRFSNHNVLGRSQLHSYTNNLQKS